VRRGSWVSSLIFAMATPSMSWMLLDRVLYKMLSLTTMLRYSASFEVAPAARGWQILACLSVHPET
jgi:hypothetical protein